MTDDEMMFEMIETRDDAMRTLRQMIKGKPH
jgi:hypothetical protein